jgi:hypothetical protein
MQAFFSLLKKSFLSLKKHPLVLSIIAILLVSTAFIYHKMRPFQTTPQYQTATAQKGTLISSIAASGSVASTNNTPVTTRAS